MVIYGHHLKIVWKFLGAGVYEARLEPWKEET